MRTKRSNKDFSFRSFQRLILSYLILSPHVLLLQRYISEPPEQVFIDFCTIAKVRNSFYHILTYLILFYLKKT